MFFVFLVRSIGDPLEVPETSETDALAYYHVENLLKPCETAPSLIRQEDLSLGKAIVASHGIKNRVYSDAKNAELDHLQV